jgi:hypothetical protein
MLSVIMLSIIMLGVILMGHHYDVIMMSHFAWSFCRASLC